MQDITFMIKIKKQIVVFVLKHLMINNLMNRYLSIVDIGSMIMKIV